MILVLTVVIGTTGGASVRVRDTKGAQNLSTKSLLLHQDAMVGETVSDTTYDSVLQKIKDATVAPNQMTDREVETYLQTMTGATTEVE